MAGIARPCNRLAAYAITLLTVFFTPFLSAQTLTLAQLPYQDPAPLDALLAQNENQFSSTLQTAWPQTESTLLRYIRPGMRIHDASAFLNDVMHSCLSTHQASSCRLYMDFLSWLMQNKRPDAAPKSVPLPVLLRPAQLPWHDTAALNALLLLDTPLLDSALQSHWGWIEQIIHRYLPDQFELHPISKVFADVRSTCKRSHSEVSCRVHFADIDALIDQNKGAPPTLFRTLAQIPYRDPAPIDKLLALPEPQLRTELSRNWAQVDLLLNRYISGNIAIAGNLVFAASRLDCQAWMPGDYFMCKNYLHHLSSVMHSKAR